MGLHTIFKKLLIFLKVNRIFAAKDLRYLFIDRMSMTNRSSVRTIGVIKFSGMPTNSQRAMKIITKVITALAHVTMGMRIFDIVLFKLLLNRLSIAPR